MRRSCNTRFSFTTRSITCTLKQYMLNLVIPQCFIIQPHSCIDIRTTYCLIDDSMRNRKQCDKDTVTTYF
uniref:Uncharacterized protein n=1 Tax=Arundo donax TaxID=35708 RepID=A0A0A9DB91_ARUDO